MKYTKKQIKQAYVKWVTDERLTPTEFSDYTDEDVHDVADRCVDCLIEYMN